MGLQSITVLLFSGWMYCLFSYSFVLATILSMLNISICICDALNNTGCIVYDDWLVENNELGGMRKNEIIAYYQVLFYNLLDETEENHADCHKGSLYSSQIRIGWLPNTGSPWLLMRFPSWRNCHKRNWWKMNPGT